MPSGRLVLLFLLIPLTAHADSDDSCTNLVDCKPKADEIETTTDGHGDSTTPDSLTNITEISNSSEPTSTRPTALPPDLPYTVSQPPASAVSHELKRQSDSAHNLLIGGACGGIIGILCIGVVVIVCVRKSKKSKKKSKKQKPAVVRKNLSYDRNSIEKESWPDRWKRERAEASAKKKAKRSSKTTTQSTTLASSASTNRAESLGSFDASTTNKNASLGSFN